MLDIGYGGYVILPMVSSNIVEIPKTMYEFGGLSPKFILVQDEDKVKSIYIRYVMTSSVRLPACYLHPWPLA